MSAKRWLTINNYSVIALLVGFLLLATERILLTRFMHTLVCVTYITSLVFLIYFSRPMFRLWRSTAKRTRYIFEVIGFAAVHFIILLYTILLSLGLLLSYARVKAKGEGYRIYLTGSFLNGPSYMLCRYWYVVEEYVSKDKHIDIENEAPIEDGKVVSVTSQKDSIIVLVKRHAGDTTLIFHPRQ